MVNKHFKKDPKRKQNDRPLLIIAVLSVVFIVGILYLTIFELHSLAPDKRGTFGDMFGAANALFSGLAFVGIIITILLQRTELALQRQELTDTRKELERSATAQEQSQRALTRQANNLKISAKLSALNSLVAYYADLEARSRQVAPRNSARAKKEAYVARIEQLLELKENSITYSTGSF